MENTTAPTLSEETVTFKRSHFYAVITLFADQLMRLIG